MLSTCYVYFNKCLRVGPHPSESVDIRWTILSFIILLLVLVLSVRTISPHVTLLITPVAQKLSIWSSIRILFLGIVVVLGVLLVLVVLWILWILWTSAVPLCRIRLLVLSLV